MAEGYRKLQQPNNSQELAQSSCDDLLSYRVACNNTKMVDICSVIRAKQLAYQVLYLPGITAAKRPLGRTIRLGVVLHCPCS